MCSPSSSSAASIASCCVGRSSTTRMLIGWLMSSPGSPHQPRTKYGQQLLRIHGLGEVVPGAGFDALLAISLHGLGRHRDDRQVVEPRNLAKRAHGVVPVHL